MVATTEKKQQIIFSKAGKGEKEAYYLFGDMAVKIAALLAMETGKDKKDRPMLTIHATQFEDAKTKLEAAGYAIVVDEATNKPVAELRLFEGEKRSGANIFGEPAKVVADALNVKVGTTRKNEFYLTLNTDQIGAAVSALEAAGYLPRQLKELTVIQQPSNRYCLIKEAAELGSDHFEVAVETSQSGNPKLNVTTEQFNELRAIAKQKGFYFKVLTQAELDSRKQQEEEKAE